MILICIVILVKKILEEDFPKAPDDPTICTCQKNRSGLTESSFNRITKNCLKFHLLKMEKKHEMKEKDFADRLEFAQWYCSLSLEEKENFGFSDEASFSLNGSFNTQNVRKYALPKSEGGEGRPKEFFLPQKKFARYVMVFLGLLASGFFGLGSPSSHTINLGLDGGTDVKFMSVLTLSKCLL